MLVANFGLFSCLAFDAEAIDINTAIGQSFGNITNVLSFFFHQTFWILA
jgi:hypothetical protein